MSGLTWLHLSDWHQKGGEFDRTVVCDALMKDIENRTEISPDLEKIDFIIFSGDVAFHGKTEEYQSAIKQFFNPLLESTGVERGQLFIVAGNHDLERDALELLPKDLLNTFKNQEKVNEWLTDGNKRRALLGPMQNYSQFLIDYFGEDIAGSGPVYGYTRHFDTTDKKIVVIGLNSAWLCARHKEIENGEEEVNDYGYLILGEPQLYEALRKTSDTEVRIAILHHPFDWLTAGEKSLIRSRLQRECHFILHGHEHEPNVTLPQGTIGDCAIISAGSSYDRREPTASRYANGYNFVHLDFETGQGTVFLRRYEDRQGWIRDTGTTGDDTPGYSEFTLPKNLGEKKSVSMQELPTSYVQLNLECDINEFNETKNSLVNVIAALLSIDRRSIRILHVSPGSIRVIIELFTDCAMKLVDLFNTKNEKFDHLLSQFFVKNIKVLNTEELSQLLSRQLDTPIEESFTQPDTFKWKFPFEPELFVDRETDFLKEIPKEGQKPFLEFIGIRGSGKSELLKWICYHDSFERDYLAAYVDFQILHLENAPLSKDIFLVLEIILGHFPGKLYQKSRSLFQKNLSNHRDAKRGFLFEPNPTTMKQLEDKLFITFNNALKTLLKKNKYKIIFCLDNVDDVPEIIFEQLENRVLENLACYDNFMLVVAGREQINWKNETIKTRIGDRKPQELYVLPKEGTLKQLTLLSKQKRFGLEDSTSIRERLHEFTSGHARGNYELINFWTKGFTFPLCPDVINVRQSLHVICSFFTRELEQYFVKKQIADEYPSVLEMLAYFAILRNIEVNKLFFLFPVFFEEKCKGKEHDYFKRITDIFTKKQFHILLPLSSSQPPQNNLQPIVRYVVLKIQQISLLDLLEKIKKGYDTLIEYPQSTPLKQIEYIVERLYHSGQYLSAKSFNESHSNRINTSLQEKLDIYLEKYFRNAKPDLLDKFVQYLDYLESDEKKCDTPLLSFSVDVPALKQRVRNFQHRVKTCQN